MKKYRTIYFSRQYFDTTSVETEATSVNEAITKAELELKKSLEVCFEEDELSPEELAEAVAEAISEGEYYHVATFEFADGAEYNSDFFEL